MQHVDLFPRVYLLNTIKTNSSPICSINARLTTFIMKACDEMAGPGSSGACIGLLANIGSPLHDNTINGQADRNHLELLGGRQNSTNSRRHHEKLVLGLPWHFRWKQFTCPRSSKYRATSQVQISRMKVYRNVEEFSFTTSGWPKAYCERIRIPLQKCRSSYLNCDEYVSCDKINP